MNARKLLLAAGLLWQAQAHALPAAELAREFLADPLRTTPPVIESGATLPGDASPVPCAPRMVSTSPLTLVEAVDLALCNNPQIKMAWAGIKIQAGALGEARAAYLPTLSATTSFLRTQIATADTFNPGTTNHGTTINGALSWRLFDFGGREANREAANRLLAAAIAHHDAALQKTLANVIQSFFDAQSAKATLQTKEQNETIAQSTFDSTQRRAARGAAAMSDTLQATTALAKATLEKNRAEGAHQKSLAVLGHALGLSPQAAIVLADDDMQDREDGATTVGSKSLNDWLELARQAHPAIVAASAEWEASEKKVVATRSEGRPVMDFTVNHYRNGLPNQGVSATKSRQTTVGVAVTLPLFDGFANAYKVKGAQAVAEQRLAHLQDTQRNVLLEVLKAHADATAALNNLQASARLLAAAQESLRTSQRKYDRGAADILEVLNTQMALADAQEQRIRSLAEWRSARLGLLANVGVMNRAPLAR